ncbi:FHA domain-containing protein [Georgenia yuyongxinii]|uniref:FHA domain-containing protein n=1 Tax=Georgenia yuyongxinii TaxID=2589797 RepID=A0A5B8C6G6_9MICO|nr:FHA domain-containing protein [Georgenia yuyongxinii]QDC26329.1 FHA domain-containing protein [Georgenia yuyongxinii]
MTSEPGGSEVAFLDVLSWDPLRAGRILISQDVVVGSAEPADLCFADPLLSPAHAAIRYRGGGVFLEDLGSTAGTFVNGVAVTDAQELHTGDVITLGEVRLRFGADAAAAAPASPEPAPVLADSPVTDDLLAPFDTGPVTSGVMAPGQYADLVVRRRDELLAQMDMTRRHGRRLIWGGAVLVAVGGLVFLAGVLAFLQLTGGVLDRFGRPPDIFGWELAGVLTGHVGWAVAGAGLFGIIVGVALHQLASWRRRRLDREVPVPPSAWLVRGELR